MKFPQLSIGQRFEWRGRIYTKSGPVAGTDTETGNSQVIPRSALVNPLAARPPPSARKPEPLSAERLEPVLAAYRRETLAWAAAHLDAAAAGGLERAMEEIARRLVDEVG